MYSANARHTHAVHMLHNTQSHTHTHTHTRTIQFTAIYSKMQCTAVLT